MRRALLLLFAAWLVSAQPTSTPPAGSIHGVVKDQYTGAPIADYDIQFVRDGVHSTKYDTTSTDDEGHYLFPSVPTGEIRVVAGSTTNTKVTRTVQLADGQDLTVDFLIPTSPVISGRVVDENNQPEVDAWVWVIKSEYAAGVLRRTKIGPRITAEEGTFTFDSGLQPGRAYYLLVDLAPPDDADTHKPLPLDRREPIQAPTYYGEATSLEAATPLTLRHGEHREGLDIKIRKTASYCVDGKVEFAGQGMSTGLAISEQALNGADLTRIQTSPAEDGTFRVCDLTPGQCSVFSGGGSTGFAIADSDVHQVLVNVGLVALHLQTAWDGDPPATPKTPERLALLAGGPEGELRDQAARLSQQLAQITRNYVGSAQGSEIAIRLNLTFKNEPAPYDGPYGNIAPGDYRLEVHVAAGSYIKEMTYQGVAITDGILHLAAGANGTLRVIATQGAARLTCTAADADGHPIADSTVILVPEKATTAALFSTFVTPGQTDSEGRFVWNDLAPGKYRVVALKHSYRSIPEDIDKLLLLLFKAPSVELDSKSQVSVNLQPVSIE